MDRRSFLLRTTGCLLSLSLGIKPKKIYSFNENSIKKAWFFKKDENEFVRCQLCFRGCSIAHKKRGFCRVRENRKGELYSLVYGKPAGLQIDPIELEPMYHLVPGHRNLCVYTASCNFRCKHCHNWPITHFPPEQIRSYDLTPEKIVEETIRQNCQSISFSINEPTIFYEMMIEVAQLAKKRGLLTLCHTNGGIRKAPLLELLPFLDAVTVDLKAFTSKFYEEISQAKIEPVLETLLTIREANKHLEIVNLIIPTLNDHLEDIKKMCRWIAENLGKDTPLHFTRFSPAHKITHLPPTPIKTLEEARTVAMAEGLRFVYIGNVVGHPGNSTYCPNCGHKVIERSHFVVKKNLIKEGKCPFCGEKIPGIWIAS
ncbi:MAG: AmmeMemoRadiSam system radical SAM enzyme [Candidatus Aminicenantes bacterium]|nr:AmmeMemoRadiSam system radical SAM enzyme [Candidatus Aminicenantes bacterium]